MKGLNITLIKKVLFYAVCIGLINLVYTLERSKFDALASVNYLLMQIILIVLLYFGRLQYPLNFPLIHFFKLITYFLYIFSFSPEYILQPGQTFIISFFLLVLILVTELFDIRISVQAEIKYNWNLRHSLLMRIVHASIVTTMFILLLFLGPFMTAAEDSKYVYLESPEGKFRIEQWEIGSGDGGTNSVREQTFVTQQFLLWTYRQPIEIDFVCYPVDQRCADLMKDEIQFTGENTVRVEKRENEFVDHDLTDWLFFK